MILSSVCLSVLLASFIFSWIGLFVAALGDLTKYGEPCKNIIDCSILSNLECRDGTCQCSSIGYKTYSSHAEVSCVYRKRSGSWGKCEPPCPTGQYCKRRQCRCNNGTVMVGSDCHEAVVRSPMEDCSVKEDEKKAYVCDNSKFSFCQYPKCVCYSEFFYNSTSKACEKKSDSYLYGVKGYKSRVNEYCGQDSDCFNGLKCLTHKAHCTCPSDCKYIEKYGACDCGEIKFESPSEVFWIGLLLGLASALSWCWKIFRVCLKSRKKLELEELQEFRSSYLHQPSPMPQPTPHYSSGESKVNILPSKVANDEDEPPPYPPPPPPPPPYSS